MAALFAVTALLFGVFSGERAQAQRVALKELIVFGEFRQAHRLSLSPQGWLYVIDTGDHSVSLFKDFHSSPIQVGGFGWTPGTFDRPSGIVADGLNVYVSDFNNHRLQRFDRNLNYLSSFSTRDTTLESARFGFPTGLAVARLGDLFILDSENLRVLRFTPQLRFQSSFAGLQPRRGMLRNPIKIVVSPSDRIYVLEPDRILEYDYFGAFVRSWGEGILDDARGVDADAEHVVVAGAEELYWFSPEGVVKRRMPYASFITDEPVGEVKDVAVDASRLFLLTSRRVHVFEVGWQGED